MMIMAMRVSSGDLVKIYFFIQMSSQFYMPIKIRILTHADILYAYFFLNNDN